MPYPYPKVWVGKVGAAGVIERTGSGSRSRSRSSKITGLDWTGQDRTGQGKRKKKNVGRHACWMSRTDGSIVSGKIKEKRMKK